MLVYKPDVPWNIPRAFGGKRSLIYVSVPVDNRATVGKAGCHRAAPYTCFNVLWSSRTEISETALS